MYRALQQAALIARKSSPLLLAGASASRGLSRLTPAFISAPFLGHQRHNVFRQQLPAFSPSVRFFADEPPKVPKGFEHYVPKRRASKGEEEPNTEKRDEPAAAAAKEDEQQQNSQDKSSRSDSADGKPNSDAAGKSTFQFFSSEGLLGGIVIATAFSIIFGLSSSSEEEHAMEISWNEFRTEFLANNMVDHLKVVNGQLVRVYLKQPVTITSRSNTDSAQSSVTRQLKQVYFVIGSVTAFDKKLDAAQNELHIPPERQLPVTYDTETTFFTEVLKLAPTLLLIGGAVFLMRRAGGAGGAGGMRGIFNVGKSPATMYKQGEVKVQFKDVAGLDEAKVEILEFVDFLKTPGKFTRLGAKIPKGALLVGPPGTGKTLLAKAVAGEASVPFFSISGSDFVEMFVGVGPSRVRDLFAQARQNAPCILFIDEIDAIGRSRGKGGFTGGNDERENTLNQLLVEMDGLKGLHHVVILAGTNRSDVLDPALTRAGRFDRHIFIDLPDLNARKQIFEVHLKPLKLAEPIESYSKRMATLTPGMSGAEIANVCNEAALHAAREGKKSVEFLDFQYAADRVIAGLERKSRVLAPPERRTVAYHEAGHTVAGWFLEHADPVLKVSIVPRGAAALGFTQYLPRDRKLHSKDQMMDMVCMTLGGRIAEQMFFGKASTGAADDLDRITKTLYQEVALLGMDTKFGPISYPQPQPGEIQLYKPYSEQTGALIDERVRELVREAYKRTFELLTQQKESIIKLAEALLVKEVLTQEDVASLIGARPFQQKTAYEEYVYGDKGLPSAATSTSESKPTAPPHEPAAPAPAM